MSVGPWDRYMSRLLALPVKRAPRWLTRRARRKRRG